ncbi:MAG: phosphatidate cytidylyltransferase [Bacteroidetes bacterium]|nr:phosphatidate cytidylyltransferase [Bacteroidota bacterium]
MKEAQQENQLLKRSLTGALLIGVIIAMIFVGSNGFLLLLLVINELAILEYQRLIDRTGVSIQKLPSQVIGALFIFISWLLTEQLYHASILMLIIPVIPFMFIIELFRAKPNPFQNIALSIMGLIWISVPLSLFLCIGFLPFQAGQYMPLMIMAYFIILWFGDTGAYLAGTMAGKHKLFPRVSPHKTWEGSIGGLLLALLAGSVNYLLFHYLQLSQWLGLAVIINVSGTLGDFTKSMLKRTAGVKDSGTILPGHGGILDRFDSLIGSAPFAFIYLYYIL